jgi:Na+/melibiose symporter-like transporter
MSALISLVNLPGSLMDIAHRTLTSNSIDEVELKTGVRSEGVSFSMQNFTTKMTSAVTTFIEGRMLGFLKYDSKLNELGKPQNAKFIKWQWPMFMLGPVVGAVLYLIAISFIKDGKEHREEVERQLKERKEALESGKSTEKVLSSENA